MNNFPNDKFFDKNLRYNTHVTGSTKDVNTTINWELAGNRLGTRTTLHGYQISTVGPERVRIIAQGQYSRSRSQWQERFNWNVGVPLVGQTGV